MKNINGYEVTFDAGQFIKAFARFENIGGAYLDNIEKWQHYFNIVEAYRLAHGDISQLGESVARKVAENGIEAFEAMEFKYGRKALMALCDLDSRYAKQNDGKHFKSYFRFSSADDLREYLVAIDDIYNDYMAGGHIDWEDR